MMKALVLNNTHQPLDYQDVDMPAGDDQMAVVELHHAALNHRDVWITKGQYAGIRFPAILGSDGAGYYNGQPVIINPSIHWGNDERFQGPDYRILGLPDNGTFAEYVQAPKANLHPMPAHLEMEQAAAIPLAGLTAWRVLMSRCQLQAGERVLISGIGGGVALFALQFAVAAGAEVWVTSGSEEKIGRALALGAQGGISYQLPDWDKNLRQQAGGFDVVIDSAAGEQLAKLAGLCNPGGRLGIYGGTTGKINGLSPQIVFWKQISIHGSTMGSNKDFSDMLAFVNQQKIVPVIDAVFPLEGGNDALRRMDAGAQFGKIVLRIR